MKRLIPIIAILLVVSCKKPYTIHSSLDATETTMLGKWQLSKAVDSNGHYYSGGVYIDTVITYTGYPTTAYLTFYSTEYGSTSTGSESYWKNFNDASGLYQGVIFTPTSIFLGTEYSDYWYHDNQTNLLHNHSVTTTVISVSSSSLVLRRNYSATETYTWHYTK